jgi:hypothetical protein
MICVLSRKNHTRYPASAPLIVLRRDHDHDSSGQRTRAYKSHFCSVLIIEEARKSTKFKLSWANPRTIQWIYIRRSFTNATYIPDTEEWRCQRLQKGNKSYHYYKQWSLREWLNGTEFIGRSHHEEFSLLTRAKTTFGILLMQTIARKTFGIRYVLWYCMALSYGRIFSRLLKLFIF